jgi:hypothetical protein
VNLEVESSTWDSLLTHAGCTDVYYRRGYVDSAATTQAGRSAYLFVAGSGGSVVFPCIVRRLEGLGAQDVTTVGYGGPLALGHEPPLRQFHELYDAWCSEHAVITSFVRFHPLLETQRYAGPTFHRLEVEGSVAWPLEGDLFAKMHPHHRRLVRKAESRGVEVSAVESPQRLDEFIALYEHTMHRLSAARFYFFPEQYWAQIVSGLGDALVLFEARRAGTLLGGVLCLGGAPWFHYHLGATSDEARDLGTSHLLLYTAAHHAKKRGYKAFHLGSGLGGSGGSLLEFKRRFTHAPPEEQWLGKAVHDVERYLELTGATELKYEGFFPAYRRPQ